MRHNRTQDQTGSSDGTVFEQHYECWCFIAVDQSSGLQNTPAAICNASCETFQRLLAKQDLPEK